jgi:hypothetical protein
MPTLPRHHPQHPVQVVQDQTTPRTWLIQMGPNFPSDGRTFISAAEAEGRIPSAAIGNRLRLALRRCGILLAPPEAMRRSPRAGAGALHGPGDAARPGPSSATMEPWRQGPSRFVLCALPGSLQRGWVWPPALQALLIGRARHRRAQPQGVAGRRRGQLSRLIPPRLLV